MERADAQTVLAPFDDPPGIARPFRFFRDGEAWLVRAPGSDGALQQHRVVYTFGVEPLQQYLVERPGGRLQAISWAWDARPVSAGGQRWFSLHPGAEPPPGDVLHWTGPAANWNGMCAHCHSTNLRKRFDPVSASFDTTWSELDVACEACHGPGAAHVAWARDGADASRPAGLRVDLGAAREGRWEMDPERGIARRTSPLASRAEIEVCASCHSRRTLVDEDFGTGSYHDRHVLALLEPGLYHADGQVRDEVYVYGSFLQSRMYAAGVSCSDCHDPHSLELRGNGPDDVCAQCHAPERFAVRAHHGHAPDGEGGSCVACHMPSRDFMEIDARRDHSFRVPRPDLGQALGTPGACTDCHVDRDAAWASAALAGQGRDGRAGRLHFATTFARVGDGYAEVEALAAWVARADAPGIVRASALARLGADAGDRLAAAIAQAASADDPLLRGQAARSAALLPEVDRAAAIGALLRDPVRTVRSAAARSLAPLPDLPAALRADLGPALAEWQRAQTLHGDRPSAHVNLARLEVERGDLAAAETHLGAALRIGPHFVPAWIERAEVERLRGDEAAAERTLREALRRHPEQALVRHALGLLLVRTQRPEAALVELERAARLEPDEPRFAYVYAVALHSYGAPERARAALRALHERRPGHRPTLEALVAFHRDAGDLAGARAWAERLAALSPD